MTKEWVRKPFRLDPLPNVLTLKAPTQPEKGKGKKATIPTFQARSLVHFGIFDGHARDLAYFEREEKKKMKGKKVNRSSPRNRGSTNRPTRRVGTCKG